MATRRLGPLFGGVAKSVRSAITSLWLTCPRPTRACAATAKISAEARLLEGEAVAFLKETQHEWDEKHIALRIR
jgi:hypothetical protein